MRQDRSVSPSDSAFSFEHTVCNNGGVNKNRFRPIWTGL